jgi:spore germination cell wall hydrolase CwlJ-like protein
MRKLIRAAAHTANISALVAMVGVGAFHWKEAEALETVRAVSEEERHCLQQNIYFEARNQSTLGQVAVAWVTLNRVESDRYPDTICAVVWQDHAFSWTNDGKSDSPGNNELEQRAWQKAHEVTEQVLYQWITEDQDPTEGANHYHATYVSPFWADEDRKTVTIDDHHFYNLVW